MTDLRPLTIGEMLDRAVTLAVKNIVLFALIWIAWKIAAGVTYAAVAPRVLPLIRDAFGTSPYVYVALSVVWTVPLLAVYGLLRAGAFMSATNARYCGDRTSFYEAYRTSFRRWPAFLVYNLAFGVVILAFAVPVALVYVPVALLAGASQPAIVGFGAEGIWFIAFGFVQVPYVCGGFRCVAEGQKPLDALAASLYNEYSPGLRWRSILVGFIFQLIGLVYSVPLATRMLVAMAHVHLWVGISPLIQAGEAAAAIYLSALGAVVFHDMRLRGEGADLQLSAIRAGAVA